MTTQYPLENSRIPTDGPDNSAYETEDSADAFANKSRKETALIGAHKSWLSIDPALYRRLGLDQETLEAY